MQIKKYDDTIIDIVSKNELDNNNFIKTLVIFTVNDLNKLSNAETFGITFGDNIDLGGIIIPKYSKGIMITSGVGATVMALDSNKNLYVSFRNTGNAYYTRKI